MEKIMYVVAGLIGILVSYLFGRFKSNDGRRTLESLDDTLERTSSKQSESLEGARDITERSESIESGLDQSLDRVDRIESEIGESREGLASDTERLSRIQDVVAELQRRSKSKTDKHDTD